MNEHLSKARHPSGRRALVAGFPIALIGAGTLAYGADTVARAPRRAPPPRPGRPTPPTASPRWHNAALVVEVPWTGRAAPRMIFWAGLPPTAAPIWFDRPTKAR